MARRRRRRKKRPQQVDYQEALSRVMRSLPGQKPLDIDKTLVCCARRVLDGIEKGLTVHDVATPISLLLLGTIEHIIPLMPAGSPESNAHLLYKIAVMMLQRSRSMDWYGACVMSLRTAINAIEPAAYIRRLDMEIEKLQEDFDACKGS